MNQGNGVGSNPHPGCGMDVVDNEKGTCGNVGLTRRNAHILLVPHPTTPHLTPMVHLAEQLVSHGGITCTILSFDFIVEKLANHHLSDGIELLGLPRELTGFSTMPGIWPVVMHIEELGFVTGAYIERLLQEQAAGEQTGSAYTCLISDLLLGWTVDTAAKLKVPRYILSASSALSNLPLYDLVFLKYKKDPTQTQQVVSFSNHPGVPRYTAGNIRGILDNESYHLGVFKSVAHTAGMLVNTVEELESSAMDAIRSLGNNIVAIGPLHSPVEAKLPLHSPVEAKLTSRQDQKNVDDECLRWLDEQPAKSIVYVNFGTTGFNQFNMQMVHELALGLEASQARFLWVLRPPPNFRGDKLDQLLPSGFEERVKDRALISRGWAPQLKILEHPSTATFLMHCGWNSIMESAARGISFIGWPSQPEQLLNGKSAAEMSQIGLLLPHKASEREVTRHDVEGAVRTMLSSEKGKVIMRKAEEVKDVVARAIKRGGSSHQNLLRFVHSMRTAEHRMSESLRSVGFAKF